MESASNSKDWHRKKTGYENGQNLDGSMNPQIRLPPCLATLLLQLAAERKRNAGPRVAVPWKGEVA
jgi:hypothetical protein